MALTERGNIFLDLYQTLQSPKFLLGRNWGLHVYSLQDPLVLSHLNLHSPSHWSHTTHLKSDYPQPHRWKVQFPPVGHSPATHFWSDLPHGEYPCPFHSKLLHSHPRQATARNKVRQGSQGCDKSYICSLSSALRSCDIAVPTAWNRTGRSSREELRVWTETITTTGTPPASAGVKMLLYHLWVQQSIWPVWDCCQQPRMG